MRLLLGPLVFMVLMTGFVVEARAQDSTNQQELRQEESEDYYRKWLNEDVVYIIQQQERSVFEGLTTDEEREQFIEQFWRRRDSDLTTAANEVKEEHYRRIAFANERFKSGIPGWKTDRGRVYIIHGPPIEIEAHKMGQSYQRPSHEGGGMTATYPFEIWRYQYVEGIGPDVEIEFVDPSGTGEFRLARTPWEKDALLMIPGAGRTIAEELGYSTRADHPYFKPYSADRYVGMHTRAEDDPFIRYERFVQIQRPTSLRYNDLKEIVEVNIGYNNLPFQTRSDFFQLNEGSVLVPVTVELKNKDLSFVMENGVQVARVAVYGLVRNMGNRIIAEFEDDLLVSLPPQLFDEGILGSSVYQKIVSLESRGRYKIDLVVKDLTSQSIGVLRTGIIPPQFSSDALASSSLILSDSLTKLEDVSKLDEMFVIGDIKVRPSLSESFTGGNPIWLYLQLYNAALDQSTFAPSLSVTYRVLRDGKRVFEAVDLGGESIQFSSGWRTVLIKQLPVGHIKGELQLEVQVQDQISGETLSLSGQFKVEG